MINHSNYYVSGYRNEERQESQEQKTKETIRDLFSDAGETPDAIYMAESDARGTLAKGPARHHHLGGAQ